MVAYYSAVVLLQIVHSFSKAVVEVKVVFSTDRPPFTATTTKAGGALDLNSPLLVVVVVVYFIVVVGCGVRNKEVIPLWQQAGGRLLMIIWHSSSTLSSAVCAKCYIYIYISISICVVCRCL